jgi:hypothetical protein
MPAKFLFAQTVHALKVGVHEMIRENWDNGKKHNPKDHKLENCVLDLAVKNVQQLRKMRYLRHLLLIDS